MYTTHAGKWNHEAAIELEQLKILIDVTFNKGINVKVFPNTFSAEHGKHQCFSKLGYAMQLIQLL